MVGLRGNRVCGAGAVMDPLRAAKGIFWAVIFGAACWVIIGYFITVLI